MSESKSESESSNGNKPQHSFASGRASLGVTFFPVVKSFDANTANFVLTVKTSINAPTEVLDLGDCLDIT